MKIAIGCDPNGQAMKEALMNEMDRMNIEYSDFGSDDVIYANTAINVAEAVAAGKYDRGVLICGTGLGVSIAANKVPGAYAAACSDTFAAERAIKSNNANILTMGCQITGIELAKQILEAWLNSVWQSGTRSEVKVQRILEYEKKHSIGITS